MTEPTDFDCAVLDLLARQLYPAERRTPAERAAVQARLACEAARDHAPAELCRALAAEAAESCRVMQNGA